MQGRGCRVYSKCSRDGVLLSHEEQGGWPPHDAEEGLVAVFVQGRVLNSLGGLRGLPGGGNA